MKSISLMYHDVCVEGSLAQSGFEGPGPETYKLDKEAFHLHLVTIKSLVPHGVELVTDRISDTPVFLTFDDGGRSASETIGPLLERFGWRGHFFVTTDKIGCKGFVTERQIKELHDKGHLIGSHSASHPSRMSNCSRDQLCDEWSRSLERIGQIVGSTIDIASVPGGYYSKQVVAAAAECGIKHLFTSEPITSEKSIAGCRVFGRFAVRRKTSEAEVGSIVSGRIVPRAKQYLMWNAKKGMKRLGGELYLRTRKRILKK